MEIGERGPRIVPTEGARMTLIERTHDCSLVPWRPTLDRLVGETVDGKVRGDSISWTIGLGRSGPAIS
jgi:hypothetical protein